MSHYIPRDVRELLDTLERQAHELELMVAAEVPEEARKLTPGEALEFLHQAIFTGQIKPVNHPKRLSHLLIRLVRGELEFEHA